MSLYNDIDLLLIGKTGNGKSATGNTILNRRAFISRSDSMSVTLQVNDEVSEVEGRVIKVVDGPGVGDTRMNTAESTKLMADAMGKAIAANPIGYHAFLLVVRYGGRFTAEDKDTIEFLKKLFGANVIKDFCILVMSHGDVFEEDSEESGEKFEQWCRRQQGVLKELMVECDNRVLLMNNRTKDVEKKKRQVRELMAMVDHLRAKGQRYTDKNFENAKATRDYLLVESNKPIIQEETLRETSLILQKLQHIQSSVEIAERQPCLEPLRDRVEKLLSKVSTVDQGTGALHDILLTIKSLENTIADESKFCQNVIEERERMKREEEERMAKFQAALDAQTAEYERLMQEGRLEQERQQEMMKEQERLRREMDEQRERDFEERERQRQLMLEESRKYIEDSRKIEDGYKNAKQDNSNDFFKELAQVVVLSVFKFFGF
ncbi:uncharacterized protein LOC131943700 [Physella acuta]|uniref:uncharacterized protein LOC131943700 n=1 Tax=Physella acuta TaxID=109671 RepID=UPI0027DDB214|nr:uncharacterized protein LOC131943700 [Physella acuta]